MRTYVHSVHVLIGAIILRAESGAKHPENSSMQVTRVRRVVCLVCYRLLGQPEPGVVLTLPRHWRHWHWHWHWHMNRRHMHYIPVQSIDLSA